MLVIYQAISTLFTFCRMGHNQRIASIGFFLSHWMTYRNMQVRLLNCCLYYSVCTISMFRWENWDLRLSIHINLSWLTNNLDTFLHYFIASIVILRWNYRRMSLLLLYDFICFARTVGDFCLQSAKHSIHRIGQHAPTNGIFYFIFLEIIKHFLAVESIDCIYFSGRDKPNIGFTSCFCKTCSRVTCDQDT